MFTHLFRSFRYHTARSSRAGGDRAVSRGSVWESVKPAREGQVTRAAVDKARTQVADLIGAALEEIIFTASGTEANNLALIGAVGATGKIFLDVNRLQVDLLSLSAHKLHGPKGIGALYFRKGVKLSPIVFGGGQERVLRSATENVAGIVGFRRRRRDRATRTARQATRLAEFREHLAKELLRRLPNAYFFGPPTNRLPGHLSSGLRGQEREVGRLLTALDQAGVAVSAGSACSANYAGQPSGVLFAKGYDVERVRGLIRVSLGRFNTQQQINRFLDVLSNAVAALPPVPARANFSWDTTPAEVAFV